MLFNALTQAHEALGHQQLLVSLRVGVSDGCLRRVAALPVLAHHGKQVLRQPVSHGRAACGCSLKEIREKHAVQGGCCAGRMAALSTAAGAVGGAEAQQPMRARTAHVSIW